MRVILIIGSITIGLMSPNISQASAVEKEAEPVREIYLTRPQVVEPWEIDNSWVNDFDSTVYLHYYDYFEGNRSRALIGNRHIVEKTWSIDKITSYYGGKAPDIIRYDGRPNRYDEKIDFIWVFSAFASLPVVRAIAQHPDNEFYKYIWRDDGLKLVIFYRKEKDHPELLPICGYATFYGNNIFE